MCDYERFPNIGDYGNPITVVEIYGGVAEWFMAAVLKTVVLVRAPGVRIPPPPQTQLNIGLRVAPVAVSAIPPAFANSLTAKVLQKALGSTPNGCANKK